MPAVLDASAVLAVLFDEPGRDRVMARGHGGKISAVNLAEVLSKAIDRCVPEHVRQAIVTELGLRVIPFDGPAAFATTNLRETTRHFGLSLGDRACLALAQQLGLPVLTGDRVWATFDLGIEVELIR